VDSTPLLRTIRQIVEKICGGHGHEILENGSNAPVNQLSDVGFYGARNRDHVP
jgi:hypothetical protein